MRIFVDDERNPREGLFDYVFRNGEELFQFLEENNIKNVDLLSLDHDLGSTEILDGYDIVKLLPDFLNSIRVIQFHTKNNIGFENMLHYALNIQKHNIIEIGYVDKRQLDSRFF